MISFSGFLLIFFYKSNIQVLKFSFIPIISGMVIHIVFSELPLDDSKNQNTKLEEHLTHHPISVETTIELSGIDSSQMIEKAKSVFSDFGFNDILELNTIIESVVYISLESLENEITGDLIIVFVKLSDSPKKGHIHSEILLRSDNEDALQILVSLILVFLYVQNVDCLNHT